MLISLPLDSMLRGIEGSSITARGKPRISKGFDEGLGTSCVYARLQNTLESVIPTNLREKATPQIRPESSSKFWRNIFRFAFAGAVSEN
jgi:hypothetical protein